MENSKLEQDIEELKTYHKAKPELNAMDFIKLGYDNVVIKEYYRRLAGESETKTKETSKTIETKKTPIEKESFEDLPEPKDMSAVNPQGAERQREADIIAVERRWTNTPNLTYYNLLENSYEGAVDGFCKKTGRTRESIGWKEEGEKPEIELDVGGRNVSDLAKDISDILKNKNVLFYRPNSKQVVELEKVKTKNKEKEFMYKGFSEIKPERFITLIERHAEIGIFGSKEFKMQSLSKNKSSIVLCSDILRQSLPHIERIFQTPLPIMYEGKITFPKKGYDERFNSWTDYDAPEIDETMNLEGAKKVIEELYSEFCFVNGQDKSNAIAGLITPFLRGLYPGFNTRTPIFFYLGNRERVGKDYCAGITGIVYDGQAIDDCPISSGDFKGNNNEELRKKITSALLGGRKRMHFANNKGHINNAILEQVSTSKIFSDRLLGRNDVVDLPNELDFSLSGNVGVTYTPDFANRCRFINMFLEQEDANSRVFDNPLLHEHIENNRGLILSALFALVKNWAAKGSPKGKVPFSSFPSWANICGGVMETAGYDSPCLIDKNSLSIAGDTETNDMKQLFEMCFEKHPNMPIKKNEIINIINDEELFSFYNFKERSGQTAFALNFKKFIGRVLSGIKLQVVNPNIRPNRQEYIFRKV